MTSPFLDLPPFVTVELTCLSKLYEGPPPVPSLSPPLSLFPVTLGQTIYLDLPFAPLSLFPVTLCQTTTLSSDLLPCLSSTAPLQTSTLSSGLLDRTCKSLWSPRQACFANPSTSSSVLRPTCATTQMNPTDLPCRISLECPWITLSTASQGLGVKDLGLLRTETQPEQVKKMLPGSLPSSHCRARSTANRLHPKVGKRQRQVRGLGVGFPPLAVLSGGGRSMSGPKSGPTRPAFLSSTNSQG